MYFREFFDALNEPYTHQTYSDLEVANMYLNNPVIQVREIAAKTERSVAEVYRILRRHGAMPNRMHINHDHVMSLADAGFPVQKIAEFTGYTPRNVRYILKNEIAKRG